MAFDNMNVSRLFFPVVEAELVRLLSSTALSHKSEPKISNTQSVRVQPRSAGRSRRNFVQFLPAWLVAFPLPDRAKPGHHVDQARPPHQEGITADGCGGRLGARAGGRRRSVRSVRLSPSRLAPTNTRRRIRRPWLRGWTRWKTTPRGRTRLPSARMTKSLY